VEVLISEEADIDRASERLLAATVQPLVTDLEIAGSGILAVAPRHPGDVFRNQPLVLLASLDPSGGTLEIRGRHAGASRPWTWRQDLPSAGTDAVSTPMPLGALFGREAIEDCETLFAAGSDNEKEIERLGLRHRIASRMTSLVAVSEIPSVDPKAPRRRERLAVEVPADVSAEMAGIPCPSSTGMPMLRVGTVPCLGPPTAAPRGASRDLSFEMEDVAEFSRRPASRARIQVPSRLPIHRVTVLHVDGGTLILEFEVPVDGFELPADGNRAEVDLGDGSSRKARIVGRDSSPAGPHRAGTIVRLAFKLGWRAVWKRTELLIAVPARIHFASEVREVEVTLVLGPQAWLGE
jgi:hypothetical protein